jgi:hypothetical protein
MKFNPNLISARLDQHVLVNNDSRCFAYKHEWLLQVKNIITTYKKYFNDSRVLEVGAGVNNPLGSSIISVNWGCKEAVAVEPGGISKFFLEDAYITSALAYVSHPEKNILSSINVLETLWVQVKDIKLDLIEKSKKIEVTSKISLYNETLEKINFDQTFDIIHSNAVLEHIDNLSLFVSYLKDISSKNSIHVHKIDFIDHDFYSVTNPEPIDGFRFLLKKSNNVKNITCNRLRLNQVIDILVDAGFTVLDIPKLWYRKFPIEYLKKLDKQFVTIQQK